jgi:K+ transporter
VPAEAVKYAAVLGANYPGSDGYERAFKLVGKSSESAMESFKLPTNRVVELGSQLQI